MERMRILLILLGASTIALSPHASFETTKKHARQISLEYAPLTLYCGCPYDENGYLSIQSCWYRPRSLKTKSGKANIRAFRMEWDHIVPASRIGRGLACWDKKEAYPQCKGLSGRKCCRKINMHYRAMENDLHNLWPVVGELNADRSNKEFNSVPGEERKYGYCDVEIDKNFIEVDDPAKGPVARSYLHMAKKWKIPLSQYEISQYTFWNENFPPTQYEIDREEEIGKRTGVRNTYIKDHSRVKNGKVCSLREDCCRVCSAGTPCGGSCIPSNFSCRMDAGCACAEEQICD